MLILVREAYESELLVSHVGVYAEIRGEVILSIHWGSVPYTLELTIFIVKSPYAPLKPYFYIPSPAFSVVEGLTVV